MLWCGGSYLQVPEVGHNVPSPRHSDPGRYHHSDLDSTLHCHTSYQPYLSSNTHFAFFFKFQRFAFKMFVSVDTQLEFLTQRAKLIFIRPAIRVAWRNFGIKVT